MAGGSSTPPSDDLGIPEGSGTLSGAGLSRLAEATNRVLATAAVVGLEFEPAVVERAAGVGEDELLAALEGSHHWPGCSPRCRAPATASATPWCGRPSNDELTGARGWRSTGGWAQAIESVHGRALDDHLPPRANHWARASAPAADTDRAIDYAARAGDRALAQLAYDEAAAYYHQALELLAVAEGLPDDGRQVELLIGLGEAQRRAGDRAHRETLLEAARLAADRAMPTPRAGRSWPTPGAFGPLRSARSTTSACRRSKRRWRVARPDESPTRARLLGALGLGTDVHGRP